MPMQNYIQRAMQPALRNALSVFPIATVCGPRQSGKTTMCRMEFPELPYVNLEDISFRTLAMEDPKGFLARFPSGAIIDEAQLAPALFSQIQVIVDDDRFSGNDSRKFVLTGSRNFALLPELRQSLAGRTGVFTLLPLSTDEILSCRTPDFSPEEMIISGGYPGVWNSPFSARGMVVDNYIDTYVERDVRRLMDVKDLHKFSIFLRLCAARIGSELNKSSLAVEVGVSVPTVDSWLSVLEASFVVHLLQPWHANIGKRLVKAPKLYFTDTAVACRLLGLQEASQLAGHPMRGALFENLVINNVLKSSYNRGDRCNLNFYRDKSGHEIDLIVETPHGIDAYEIKAGMSYRPEYFRNIDYVKDLLGDGMRRSGVVYAGDVEKHTPDHAIINYLNFPDKFKVQH